MIRYQLVGPQRRSSCPKVCCTLFILFAFATLIGIYLSTTEFGKTYAEDFYFDGFIQEYQKKYSSADEREQRKRIFLDNHRKIMQINSEGHPYTLGINQFADLTDEEFEQMYLTENPVPESILAQGVSVSMEESEDPGDDNIDWVAKGKVAPVKDQGNCGSCWTFASISVAETFYAIKKDELKIFSEQQLVDCCRTTLSKGCQGGEAEDALRCLKQNKSMLATDYPYVAMDQDCRYDKSKALYGKTVGYGVSPKGDTNDMQKWLRTRTLYVSVNASPFAFRFYKSGIITNGCPGHQTNHGVTLVGSGVEKGVKFWRIKNSWGRNWGDKGFLRIERKLGTDVLGVCGIGRHGVHPE
eukprot:TRINITY_DN5703_c0_g2_i1.p1 TRINITY_DN5703_c0_g2~~TRINITY_DN5703_c0_g2_i1.p1  ORF type:complete len:355 (+),score=71.02 TRINITY_DN5703_c0_g2_i1:175-1239(+)